MSGTSPLRNGLSLAQRFAYKPAESSSASAAVSSACKRRKLATSSGDASLSTASTDHATIEADAAHAVIEESQIATAPAKADTVNSSVKANGTSDSKGKKRALSPEAGDVATLNNTARAFVTSLSNKEIAGVGGSLSERQLLALESETMDPSWLQALFKECAQSLMHLLTRI